MSQIEHDDDPGTNTLLYVLFVVYFASLVGVAVVAYGKKRAAIVDGGDISAQFGGSFSAPLLVLTTFSTVFSGYTVVGVPSDASRRGFTSLRWVTCVVSIVSGMLLYNPRLRRLSVVRGYISPLDFITDRYRSRVLRLLAGICMCVPQILYLTVQFVSFASVVGGIFQDVPHLALMIIFGVLVLGMEFLGGMNSVVLTDAIQSVVMVAAFVIVPFVLWAHYGTFTSFVGHAGSCDNLFYVNSWTPNEHTAPAVVDEHHVNATAAGCLGDTKPAFLEYPTKNDGFFLFFFTFNQISFALNPHLVQRVFIAKNDNGLRVVAATLLASAFLTMLPGIYMGMVKEAYQPSWPESSRALGTFNGVSAELMKQGPFEQLLMSIMICSSMAAVMSSTDSVMMGVSSTVAVDLVQGLLAPGIAIGNAQAVHVGELVSVVQVFIAVACGINITPAKFPFMLTLQAGILAQVVPAFLLGLRTQVSVRAIVAGMVTGLGMTGVFSAFGTLNVFAPLVPYPTVALALNVVVVAVVNLLARGEDLREGAHYDDLTNKYGGPMLTMKDVNSVMKGTTEVPMLVPIGMFAIVLAASPIWLAAGGKTAIIWGWPAWAFILLWLCLAATLLGFVGIYIWNPPSEDKGLEIEVVELADLQ